MSIRRRFRSALSGRFVSRTAARTPPAPSPSASVTTRPEQVAQAFHTAYEALAPDFGYSTRAASAKPWADVPEQNRNLMAATVRKLIRDGVIVPGESPGTPTS